LAEIIYEHNQKAVEMFLLAADPTGKGSFWIGLTDLFHEGTFIWPSTGEQATYFNWKDGQPDNAGNGIKHFAMIYPASLERKWNDYYNYKKNEICSLSIFCLINILFSKGFYNRLCPFLIFIITM